MQPDIIVTGGGAATVAVERETRTIPIVSMTVADPLASGRLDRPTENITGFAILEPYQAWSPASMPTGDRETCHPLFTCLCLASIGIRLIRGAEVRKLAVLHLINQFA